VATIITLVTSALGFVAALAWNDALTQLLNPTIESSLKTLGLPTELAVPIKAIAITLIAVVAVVILNRVARRMVKQSAINAADAESMM
jgi:divalent metal cation (Fe/Co/Zn/Cd) transporter